MARLEGRVVGELSTSFVNSFPPSWAPASFLQCVEFEFQNGLIINSPVLVLSTGTCCRSTGS